MCDWTKRFEKKGIKVINPSTALLEYESCGQRFSPMLPLRCGAWKCPKGCSVNAEVKRA